MTDPCHALHEKVMLLGKKLGQSSLANFKWDDDTFFTKEDIHKMAEEIELLHNIDEEFKFAVFELADCLKRTEN